MSKIIVVAASNGKIFKECGFEKNTECIWVSGARTLHEKGNPRRLQNLIALALKKSPRLIIIYADILLNSLPTDDPRFQSLKKYEQYPEQIAVHLRKLGSELEQRGVEMLIVIGKRPAHPGNPEEELCKACARNDAPFFRADGKINWFRKDGVHVTLAGFSKPLKAAIEKTCRGDDLPRKHPRRVKTDASV